MLTVWRRTGYLRMSGWVCGLSDDHAGIPTTAPDTECIQDAELV